MRSSPTENLVPKLVQIINGSRLNYHVEEIVLALQYKKICSRCQATYVKGLLSIGYLNAKSAPNKHKTRRQIIKSVK